LFELSSYGFDLPFFKDDHLNDISPGAFDDLMKIENAIPAASGFAISFK